MRLPWSLLALVAALSLADAASYTIDKDFSIGARYPISDDRRTVPNFQISGSPQLLGDRIILTPPAPGNQRVGIWAQKPNPYYEWSFSTEFRASGTPERPGGSLHIWYTASNTPGTDSIYTSKPWDGLALVIDSHSGTGGLRAYLNDGKTDFSGHHNPASLAFAHCDFSYRNKGHLSKVMVWQGPRTLKVDIDGKTCFETDKARLPAGYYFGVTAATSDTPDSFELFNLMLGYPQGAQKVVGQGKAREEPKFRGYDQAQHPPAAGKPAAGKPAAGKQARDQDFGTWKPEKGEEDHEADFYKTSKDQFADVHNRLQALTHHLAALQTQLGLIYDRVDSLHYKDEEARAEARNTRVPRDQIDKMDNRLAVVENLAIQIAQAITSKDYTQHFEELRSTLKEHHNNLLYSVPEHITQAITAGGPKVGLMVTFVVLVQVGLAAAYVVYKRRMNSMPKKYL